MFDKGNWQAFTAVIKYIEDLTVWAATTKEKGEDGKKYNLLWLLPRNREGTDGRGEMDMNNFPLLDTEAHRNCHAKLYEQLYFNLNSLVPELVSKFRITDYDSEDPDKGSSTRSTQSLRPCYGHSRTNTRKTLPTPSTMNSTASPNLYARSRTTLKQTRTATTVTSTGARI